MKKYIEKILSAFPYVILIWSCSLLLIVIIKEGITLDQFIKLAAVFVWPAVVIVALFFFRKVFSYLFFSLEEFNFFGTRGTLKNVQDLIREKADALWKKERDSRRQKKDLARLRDSKLEMKDRADQAIDLLEKTFTENEDLKRQNSALEDRIRALSVQLEITKGQSASGISSALGTQIETVLSRASQEVRDVGSTNSQDASDSSGNSA